MLRRACSRRRSARTHAFECSRTTPTCSGASSAWLTAPPPPPNGSAASSAARATRSSTRPPRPMTPRLRSSLPLPSPRPKLLFHRRHRHHPRSATANVLMACHQGNRQSKLHAGHVAIAIPPVPPSTPIYACRASRARGLLMRALLSHRVREDKSLRDVAHPRCARMSTSRARSRPRVVQYVHPGWGHLHPLTGCSPCLRDA